MKIRCAYVFAMAGMLFACSKATVASGRDSSPPAAASPPSVPYRPTLSASLATAPNEAPSDYVITPFGYFHRSCVIPLSAGDHLRKDGVVKRASGALEKLAPCTHPDYLKSGRMMALAENAPPPHVEHDWVASASQTIQPLQQISASWTVPRAPTNAGAQVLYFFPGIEPPSYTLIVQPVLGWMSGNWSISSWACCFDGHVSYSTFVNVNVGDTINGITSGSNCSAASGVCSTWTTTTTDATTGQSTTFVADPSDGMGVTSPMTWAVSGAMEVYKIDTCDQYSPDQMITFRSVALAAVSGPLSLGAWQTSVTPEDPDCNFNVSATVNSASILKPVPAPSPMGLACRPGAIQCLSAQQSRACETSGRKWAAAAACPPSEACIADRGCVPKPRCACAGSWPHCAMCATATP